MNIPRKLNFANQPSWPKVHSLTTESTALLIIDMQHDFIGYQGWFTDLGIPVDPVRTVIEPAQRVLAFFRRARMPIFHTREAYRPNGADLPKNSVYRSRLSGIGLGDTGSAGRVLTLGEPGWEIIPELAPEAGEVVIDKPAKSSFYSTALQPMLNNLGIQNLLVAGVTTDVCVQSTLRDADDLGFECLMIADGCAASAQAHHADNLRMLPSPWVSQIAVASASEILTAIEEGSAFE